MNKKEDDGPRYHMDEPKDVSLISLTEFIKEAAGDNEALALFGRLMNVMFFLRKKEGEFGSIKNSDFAHGMKRNLNYFIELFKSSTKEVLERYNHTELLKRINSL